VFGVQDADAPATSTAYSVRRSASGQISTPRAVPGALEPLAVAFDGSTAVLLAGTSPSGQTCCASAGITRMGGGGSFRRGQTLAGPIAGATVGQLVPLAGRILAAIATARGVWVSQSGKGGRFGSAQRLTAGNSTADDLQAAALPKGGGVVAFTETRPPKRADGPASIFVASGSQKQAPHRARAAIILSGGRIAGELGLSASSKATTLAWTEGSYDKHGNYVSDVAISDLTRHASIRRFAVRGTVASGLTLAGDAGGDQLLAWKTCAFAGDCSVRAAVRVAGGRFGNPSRVDAIDAASSPVAAISSRRDGLLGWIHAGHVVAAALGRGASRLSHTTVVSHTSFAADLTLGFGPKGDALAVWSQGTLSPEIVGAAYKP
jgi:hypothetical protein